MIVDVSNTMYRDAIVSWRYRLWSNCERPSEGQWLAIYIYCKNFNIAVDVTVVNDVTVGTVVTDVTVGTVVTDVTGDCGC